LPRVLRQDSLIVRRGLLIPFAVLLVAACAHAADFQAASSPLTVTEYRAQANAICTTDNRQNAAIPTSGPFATSVSKLLKVAQSATLSLSRLKPPTQLARLHAELLASVRQGLVIVSSLLSKVRAGHLTAAQFANDAALTANANHENLLWKKIGAKVCAMP
jgi:hypothetical protein